MIIDYIIAYCNDRKRKSWIEDIKHRKILMIKVISMAIKETSKLTAHLIAIIITNNANEINKWNVIKVKHIVTVNRQCE